MCNIPLESNQCRRLRTGLPAEALLLQGRTLMLWPMTRPAAVRAVAVLLVAGGCTAPEPGPDFDAAIPASRIAALESALRSRDASKTPQIVEQLDSDDPAVRLLAISTLEILTGRTYGYHYDDPPSLRRKAITRWVTYVNETPANFARTDG